MELFRYCPADDAVLAKKGIEYGLEAFSEEDWEILDELRNLTGPLAKLASFLEGVIRYNW